MHVVLGPGRGRAGAGLRQGLPDRRDHVRLQDRHDGLGRRADRGPQVARLRECRALRSAGRRRHACDVRSASRRQAVDLCRAAGQAAHQPLRRALERPAQAGGAGRHRVRGRRRLPPLDRRPDRTKCSRRTRPRRSACCIRRINRDDLSKGHARSATPPRAGSTTGSPAAASCCWCCPACRCSIRCCSSCRSCSAAANGRGRSIPGSASCCWSAMPG